MAKAKKINIVVRNQDGRKSKRSIDKGTLLKDTVNVGNYRVLLSGELLREGSNPVLKNKDTIVLLRKSGKGGA